MKEFKKKLFSIADWFDSINWFSITRKGLISAMPLIIIGSLSLMLNSLPFPHYSDFLETFLNGRLRSFLMVVNQSCFSMLSVYILLTISYHFSETFTNDTKESIIVSIISLASFCILSSDFINGQIRYTFDSTQFFSAIFCALLTSILYKRIRSRTQAMKTHYTINSDLGLSLSVSCLIPAFLILCFFALLNIVITYVFRVDSLQGLFTLFAEQLFSKTGVGYPSLSLYTFSVQFLWFFGIHGSNVLEPVMLSKFSDVGTNIFSKSFYDTFVNIGGSGVCLCVVIAILLVAKTKEMRFVSKLATFPVLFNISEIISIGIPLMFNPIFLIPYLLTPVACGTISYIATALGLVPIVSSSVTWTTPVFFSGYYATGSFSGVLLQFVLIAVGVIIYIPFIKLYEERLSIQIQARVNELTEYLANCQATGESPNLLTCGGSLEQTAKFLSQELSSALDKKDVIFKFQPQVNYDNVCIGGEALIRWVHPDAGYISPPLIIELAKESNLLDKVNELLIDCSCQLITDINAKTNKDVKISINLTLGSLTSINTEKSIRRSLKKYIINPSALWLELTENELLSDNDTVSSILLGFHNMGHKLAIDDFGMGHTSLKYLNTHNFDVVKLDASLTKDIQDNPVNQEIISSIVELGQKLNYQIIAEYVETEEQRNLLHSLGCDIYQGYLYSQALNYEDFIDYFMKHNN